MDTTEAVEAVLKTDVLGRVKTPPNRREQLLDELERSGLSGGKYAELVGVKYQTFATWVQKRRRARGSYPKVPAKRATKAESVRWLEAVVQEAQGSPGAVKEALVLELPGGVRVEVGTHKQAVLAARLVRELEKLC
jgi:hypothetical protein